MSWPSLASLYPHAWRSICAWALIPRSAAAAARSIIREKPGAVSGASRSDTNTNDGHAKRATQNHEAEKAKLQAALDRANGERARLAYELAKMKQQAERTRPAEQSEDVMLRECIINAESSGKGERVFLHQPLIEADEVKRCLAGQSAG